MGAYRLRRRLRNESSARRWIPPAAAASASGSTITTPPLVLSFPQGRSPPSPFALPGGPSTLPGQGGLAFTGFTGFGFGVAFGGWGVARGVARGVGAGVTRGVGAGVAVGGRVGVGLGFAVGGLVGPAGRADGGLGPIATRPLGSGVTVGLILADGCVDGDGVSVPGDPGGGLVVVGLGPAGVADGGAVTTGVGEVTASPPGSVRGAPKPTASAKVARTRLRTPRATTSRARWAEVTSLVLSFRPAFVGRSVLSRTREC